MAHSSSKKRRSSSSTSPKKKKKNGSKERGKSTTLLLQVAPSSPSQDPLVCSFPSGLPRALQQQQQGNDDGDAATLVDPPKFLWQKDKYRNQYQLMGKDDACLYQAHLLSQSDKASSKHKANNNNNSRTRLCVALYDKVSQTLTLHPAANQGAVYALQQSIPSYRSSTLAGGDNDNNTATTVNERLEQQRSLVTDFGSSKKQRAVQSQAANRVVSTDQVVGKAGTMAQRILRAEANMSESNRRAVQQQRAEAAATSNTANATTGTSAAVEAATQAWRDSFLPSKYNAKADEASHVYPVAAMAGPACWKQVQSVLSACFHQDNVVAALTRDWTTNSQQPNKPLATDRRVSFDNNHNNSINSVLHLVDRIDQRSTSSETSKRHALASVLLLHDWLILYQRWHSRQFIPPPGGATQQLCPKSSQERFLESFATPITSTVSGKMGYCMSKANKDRCLLHLGLLFMTAEDPHSIQTNHLLELTKDLSMDVTEVAHVLRQAGCTVRKANSRGSSNSTWTAKLTTPLVFPAAMRRGRG